MSVLYGFASRKNTEKLNRFAEGLESRLSAINRSNGFRSPSLVMKTQTGGIPARSVDVDGNDVAGVAKCLLFGSSPDGSLTDLDEELEVLNPFSSAIAGDTFIVASVCQEVLVVVAEDCG